MTNLKMNKCLTVYLLLLCIAYVCCQISFPQEHEFDKKKANAQNRRPLYSPSRCKKHELLYPGDQADDWICDCAPGAIYHPGTNACYPAFRNGPCAPDQLYILRAKKVFPECIPNACKISGQILIRNTCYELGKPGPCPQPELSTVLGVDPDTLQIDCIQQSMRVVNRFSEDADDLPYDLNTITLCARGTKRDQEGTCGNSTII